MRWSATASSSRLGCGGHAESVPFWVRFPTSRNVTSFVFNDFLALFPRFCVFRVTPDFSLPRLLKPGPLRNCGTSRPARQPRQGNTRQAVAWNCVNRSRDGHFRTTPGDSCRPPAFRRFHLRLMKLGPFGTRRALLALRRRCLSAALPAAGYARTVA